MIWIIGGTVETKILAEKIKDLDNFIISCATESEREFISQDKLQVGRMDCSAMEKFLAKHKIRLIVDLSHPYALIVSKNARKLAKRNNIRYIRYIRQRTDNYENTIYLESFNAALEYIKGIKGICFFTTGSKNLKDFESIRKGNRFIYRVLPAMESIEECKKNNVKMKDIVAILGPFSLEYNKTMFQEYKADYVIMKDSGKEGGTEEKILACHELGIVPIIIGREDEEGIGDLDIIEDSIRSLQ